MLYIIPNIIIGVKKFNSSVEFRSAHITMRYSSPGSFVINDQTINDFLIEKINGLILIHDLDSDFNKFELLSSAGILNCSNISSEYDIKDLDYSDIISIFQDILYDQLLEICSNHNIELSSLEIITE